MLGIAVVVGVHALRLASIQYDGLVFVARVLLDKLLYSTVVRSLVPAATLQI